MEVTIVLFVCVAAVLIFRPLTRKVGLVLEAMARQSAPRRNEGYDSATALLQQVNARMELLEDRLDFMERLQGARERPRLTSIGE
jgi:hypothetical protein